MRKLLFVFGIFCSFSSAAQSGKDQISCGPHFLAPLSIWDFSDSVNSRTFSPALFSDHAPSYYFLCILDSAKDTVFFTHHYYAGWNGRINNRRSTLNNGMYFWTSAYCDHSKRDTLSCAGQLQCIGMERMTPVYLEDTSDCTAYAPNAFTPNSDYVNDTWTIYFTCPAFSYDLQIYDRWGNMIWESNDQHKGWDGHLSNGSMAAMDTYVYKLTYSFTDHRKPQTRLGHFSFIK